MEQIPRSSSSDPRVLAIDGLVSHSTPEPVVSVIVPCYNQSSYAYESVLSVKQAYHGPLQIILVDDGSTDSATQRRLTELAEQHTDERCQIKIVTQENRGLSGARNSGIGRARGDFVQLLDCDDLLLPGKIDLQISHFALAPDLGVSVTDCIYSNESLDSFERHSHLIADADYDIADFANRWERGFSIPIHCALFRRSLFVSLCFEEELRSKEDWLLWIRMAAAGVRIAFVGTPGAIYRVHDTSLCRASPDVGRQWLTAALKIDHLVRPTIPNFLDDAVSWYVRTYSNLASAAAKPDGTPPLTTFPNALKTESHGIDIGTLRNRQIVKPRISVLIPVYEHFEYVGRCIQSVLNQIDQKIEIVLVDDASQDERIRPLLERFADVNGIRIHFNSENKGIAATLNRGIASATGEYIAFLDCDDLLAPGALNKALAFMDASGGCDYFFSDRYDISPGDELLAIVRYGGYADDRFTGDFRSDLLNGMLASHLKVIRRTSIERCGGFDPATSGVQDWALALQIAEFGKFLYLPEPLYMYRASPNTVTFSNRREQFQRTNIVRRRFAARFFLQQHFATRFLDLVPDRERRSMKTIKPTDLKIRDLGRRWSKQSLALDTTHGLTCDELWQVREFNSYFDQILWSAPEIHAALLGYVWSPDVLQRL